MATRVTILAAAALFMLAACGADVTESVETTTTPTVGYEPTLESDEPADTTGGTQPMQDPGAPNPEPRTDQSYEGGDYPSGLSGLVDIAIADLAARRDADEAEISVVSVDLVVWPNGALGCPKPGMAYAQVTVDGLLIVLDHGGSEYRYHSGGSIDPFLCAPGSGAVKEPEVPQIDITDPDTYPGATSEDSTPAADTGGDGKDDEPVPTDQPGGPGDPDS